MKIALLFLQCKSGDPTGGELVISSGSQATFITPTLNLGTRHLVVWSPKYEIHVLFQ